MTYLDYDKLRALDTATFQNAKPFPYANPAGLLTEEGFEALRASMPDISLFRKTVGMERQYGQKSHDRYELKHRYDLPLSPAWRDFIAELDGPDYEREIARLMRDDRFTRHYQWQYSFRGCSVSPHCDSPNKLGTHIFYFNTPEDWKSEWGGETLLLDDGGKFDYRSAPKLSDFVSATPSIAMPNRSLIFERRDHSWHAVGGLRSPDGVLRKLFTVIYDRKPSLLDKAYYKARELLSVVR